MAQRFDIGTPSQPVFSGTSVALQFSMTPLTNVTGWTVALSFKRTVNDNSFVKQYSTGSGVTTTDTANGVWTVLMSRNDTSLFSAPGTYVYSFERVDAGAEAVLTFGSFQVDRKVNS